MKRLEYFKDQSTGINIISYEDVDLSYPMHTHVGHYVLGIVTQGAIKVMIQEREVVCKEGEYFTVAPDVVHSICPVTKSYSMISTCIPADSHMDGELDIIKKEIIGNPQLEMSIADMSEKVHISSFHMIRKFSDENGLTPHKFQIQCRIRKAQELLEQGIKVTDVAQMVGFCDQSHLDRAFMKQVGITPEQYAKSAILSKS